VSCVCPYVFPIIYFLFKFHSFSSYVIFIFNYVHELTQDDLGVHSWDPTVLVSAGPQSLCISIFILLFIYLLCWTSCRIIIFCFKILQIPHTFPYPNPIPGAAAGGEGEEPLLAELRGRLRRWPPRTYGTSAVCCGRRRTGPTRAPAPLPSPTHAGCCAPRCNPQRRRLGIWVVFGIGNGVGFVVKCIGIHIDYIKILQQILHIPPTPKTHPWAGKRTMPSARRRVQPSRRCAIGYPTQLDARDAANKGNVAGAASNKQDMACRGRVCATTDTNAPPLIHAWPYATRLHTQNGWSISQPDATRHGPTRRSTSTTRDTCCVGAVSNSL
jgi:hypothetical protein